MRTKVCYEWVIETVTADEYEDILDVDHSRKLLDYVPAYLARALTGERFEDNDIEPERATVFFRRLALVRAVYDEDGDSIDNDYAYVNDAGEFDEYDLRGGLPPQRYRNELAAFTVK